MEDRKAQRDKLVAEALRAKKQTKVKPEAAAVAAAPTTNPAKNLPLPEAKAPPKAKEKPSGKAAKKPAAKK